MPEAGLGPARSTGVGATIGSVFSEESGRVFIPLTAIARRFSAVRGRFTRTIPDVADDGPKGIAGATKGARDAARFHLGVGDSPECRVGFGGARKRPFRDLHCEYVSNLWVFPVGLSLT